MGISPNPNRAVTSRASPICVVGMGSVANGAQRVCVSLYLVSNLGSKG